ncbi:ScbA/BarX family gamma-butyrolactone biosynthesis protein [Streptomyces sp. TLI_171]|uniref:ScbA/BarX family gamma-butyrolactone biosynthesis protein n=1 Tax=Streptomyces sp. TLI_171 TaxID=1938859 RepID=UPI000C18647F|nr:ScbA/BarX family gamma-butyrolactone biosynthesis protein [Streptomyces sp. TLI_171]RKE19903.1 A-factor biosynthesis hotdog protein [Streptomyces sp. TLI_171]
MPSLTGKVRELPRTALTCTVPREYVHRAAVAEVLLTNWDAVDEERADGARDFVVRAQWPRGHALFAQERGYQDPMLLVESVRQVGALLAHAEFDVPFGHQFLMWDMSYDAGPELFLAGGVPTEVELRTTCTDIVRRGNTLSEMRYQVTAVRDGRPLATASAGFRCLSPAIYRRLRDGRPRTAVPLPLGALPHTEVGRPGIGHVVLARPLPGDGNRWQLRVDTEHPIFFDHPVDHVPGMVLLEAARQAAYAATGLTDAVLTAAASTFTKYVELDSPCWIEARTGTAGEGGRSVSVRGVQDGATVFESELRLLPRPR